MSIDVEAELLRSLLPDGASNRSRVKQSYSLCLVLLPRMSEERVRSASAGSSFLTVVIRSKMNLLVGLTCSMTLEFLIGTYPS